MRHSAEHVYLYDKGREIFKDVLGVFHNDGNLRQATDAFIAAFQKQYKEFDFDSKKDEDLVGIVKIFEYCLKYSMRGGSQIISFSPEAFRLAAEMYPTLKDVEKSDYSALNNATAKHALTDQLIKDLDKSESRSGKEAIEEVMKAIPNSLMNSNEVDHLARHMADVFVKKHTIGGKYYVDNSFQAAKDTILSDPEKAKNFGKLCKAFADSKGERDITEVNKMIMPVFSELMSQNKQDRATTQLILENAMANDGKILKEILSEHKGSNAKHIANALIAAPITGHSAVLDAVMKPNFSEESLKFFSERAKSDQNFKSTLSKVVEHYKKRPEYKDSGYAEKLSIDKKMDMLSKACGLEQKGRG